MPDMTRSVGLIPDQLLRHIKKGDCVLVLGADLPLGYAGAPPSRPELARALAQRYDLPQGCSWPETVQNYLDRFNGDKSGLLAFLRDHLAGPQLDPGPVHQAIARAGFRAIVTAWYDELLERALRDAGCRVTRVVRNKAQAYTQEGEPEVVVVKLYGCLCDEGSLVLSPPENDDWLLQLDAELKWMTGLCQWRPPLFIGFDWADPMPRLHAARVLLDKVEPERPAYVVLPQPLDKAQAAWAGGNIAFISAQTTPFLESLPSRLPAGVSGGQGAIRVNRLPCKFLDYYRPKDADIFCGRDTESQVVAGLILSHRLLTLFGPSGAGKTSLLLAGVLPRLVSEGYQCVYVRALDDPLLEVRKAIAARAGQPAGDASSLRTLLAELVAAGRRLRLDMAWPDVTRVDTQPAIAPLAASDRLVVVLDQLEELFRRAGGRSRADLFHELADALDQPECDVRFVFSLREDYLPQMGEAAEFLPDILANSRRLAMLDRNDARVAVMEPAARAGVTVEPALVDALLGPAPLPGRGGEGRGDLAQADGRVPPAALQIVLDRLYREALPPGHDPAHPPPPGLCLTLAAYRAIRPSAAEGEPVQGAQGARAMLADYVDEALERLPDLKREDGVTPLGADKELGREILKVMVTSHKVKSVLRHDELVAGLCDAGVIQRDHAGDGERVKNTRLGLERARLVRSLERDEVAYYELAHDYLAGTIDAWLSREEMQTHVARELLRRELDAWRADSRLLIPPEMLKRIHERRADLRQPAPDELELLLRSALKHGYQAPYWFKRARERLPSVDGILQEVLHSEEPNVRADAAAMAGELGPDLAIPWLGAALQDDYAHVQARAREALRKIGTAKALQALRDHLAKGMIHVPAGKFIMGEGREAHEVYVEAFYMARYPVTYIEYARFVECTGHRVPQDWTGGVIPKGKENHPVVYASWHDACAYAAWAELRLPTEAEWEKAAGWEDAGSTQHKAKGKNRKYPWGIKFDETRCNTSESGIGATTPVGKYSPQGDSPYGCADMAGNVWEWTSSLYTDYPYEAGPSHEDMASAGNRVLRGGSFVNYADDARVTNRNYLVPNYEWIFNGFRCAMGDIEVR